MESSLGRLFSAVFQDFSVLDATIAENVSQAITNIDTDRVAACLEKAGLIAYAHGDYYTLGKRLGDFGFSVRKKKTPPKKRSKRK